MRYFHFILALVLILCIGASKEKSALDKKTKSKRTSPKKEAMTYTTTLSDHYDFDDTYIDGEMKAPMSTLLKGRKAQKIEQMVKLRQDFLKRLREEKPSVKSIVR